MPSPHVYAVSSCVCRLLMCMPSPHVYAVSSCVCRLLMCMPSPHVYAVSSCICKAPTRTRAHKPSDGMADGRHRAKGCHGHDQSCPGGPFSQIQYRVGPLHKPPTAVTKNRTHFSITCPERTCNRPPTAPKHQHVLQHSHDGCPSPHHILYSLVQLQSRSRAGPCHRLCCVR